MVVEDIRKHFLAGLRAVDGEARRLTIETGTRVRRSDWILVVLAETTLSNVIAGHYEPVHRGRVYA